MLAQLIAHKTHKHYQQRKDNKFALIRLLYQRGYERQEVLELLRFIDWMLRLPKALELQLKQEIALIDEEQKMKYVTSWERFALERGEIKGEAKALLKQCRLKFGTPPDWLEEKINAASEEQLDQWVEKILTAETIESLFA